MEGVLVSGFIKTSMLDYPGNIASVIFLGRCNFRCGFCHNPDIVLRSDEIPRFDVDSILRFLEKKKNWIDGVCVTGGEPTLHKGLLEFLKKIKDKGYLIKLDSNGTNPEMLKEVIDKNLVDYIAMDIKSSPGKYEKTCGVKVNLDRIKESIELIKNSGVDYEFRTTVVPELVDEEDIRRIGEWLGKDTRKYCLQQFLPIKVIDESYYDIKPYLKGRMEDLKTIAEEYFDNVELRGL